MSEDYRPEAVEADAHGAVVELTVRGRGARRIHGWLRRELGLDGEFYERDGAAVIVLFCPNRDQALEARDEAMRLVASDPPLEGVG